MDPRTRRRIGKLLLAQFGLWCLLGSLCVNCWSAFLETKAIAYPSPAWSFFSAIMAGMAGAAMLLLVVRSPARMPGVIPFGAMLLCGMAIWLWLRDPCLTAIGLTAAGAALMTVPLVAYFHDHIADSNDWLPIPIFYGLPAAGLWLGIRFSANDPSTPVSTQLGILAGLATLGVAVAWGSLYRPALELLIAILSLPLYRFREVGPGVGKIPRRGPLLVVANHAAWLDPFWLCKVIPRQVTPMMSSKYYDLPIISFLMRRVIRAIRVQDSAYRHDAPELEEAVKRLDQGECVMIFPEGWLRRREEHVIRNFGQGVWRILRERPHTPVVAFWIEGGWGSWWSHRYAPVGRGKPFDILRKITISISAPEVLSAERLADHRLTRHHLRDKVFGLRAFVPDAEPAVSFPVKESVPAKDDLVE